jgi:hypothetical protein
MTKLNIHAGTEAGLGRRVVVAEMVWFRLVLFLCAAAVPIMSIPTWMHNQVSESGLGEQDVHPIGEVQYTATPHGVLSSKPGKILNQALTFGPFIS